MWEGAFPKSLGGRQLTLLEGAFPQEAIFATPWNTLDTLRRCWTGDKRYRLYPHLAQGSFTIHTAFKTSRIRPKPILHVWHHAHTRCSIYTELLTIHQTQPTYFRLLKSTGSAARITGFGTWSIPLPLSEQTKESYWTYLSFSFFVSYK